MNVVCQSASFVNVGPLRRVVFDPILSVLIVVLHHLIIQFLPTWHIIYFSMLLSVPVFLFCSLVQSDLLKKIYIIRCRN